MTELITQLDKAAFTQVFNVLAKRLRAQDIDAADLASYYTALAGFPRWAIEQSAGELALERGRRFFPTTAEWASAIDAAIQRRLRESLIHGREWAEECTTCRDSGWKEYFCRHGNRCGRPFCEKLGETHEHSYYSPCPCRANNRTYQRNTQGSQLGHGSGKAKEA